MTTGSSRQPTVKNREWVPGAEAGWAWGKRRLELHPQKERARTGASKRGSLKEDETEGPELLGVREEGARDLDSGK